MPSVRPIGQLARRARILRRWADLIEGHNVELGQIESLGSIGPIKGVIDVDTPYATDCIRFFPGGRKISFTGTTKTGAAIMVASAESGIKSVTLELGGKSPQLVFADAPDIDKVAGCIASWILGNAGYVCVAGLRLIVQRGAEAKLIDRIGTLAKAVHPGPTWSSQTTFPPIISTPQLDRTNAVVQRTIGEGGDAVIGGKRLASIEDGAYYEPTILARVSSDMEAVREDIFGPVLTLPSFDNEEVGLSLAAHPVYELAAGVDTREINKALRAVRQIKAGTVWVNHYGRSAD